MKRSLKTTNVVDLEAFRERRTRAEREDEPSSTREMARPAAGMVVPVWVCWVPVWAPMYG